MSDKLGFAIVGCGNIGPFHAEAISKIEDAELRVACDTDHDRASKLVEKYGGDIVTDYDKMLARDDVDVVNICLPSGMHEKFTVAAAKAGKNVLVEKPLEITLAKCENMINACDENGVKLGVIFPTRFKEAYQLVRKALDAGRFGMVVMGDADIKWYRSQEYYDSGGWRGTWKMDGGGALMNQSVHSIDILQWLMGPVDSIIARAETLVRKIEVEDTAVAMLRFKSGALGVIQGTTSIYPGLSARICVHGDKGSAVIEGANITVWDFMDKEPGDDEMVARFSDNKSSGAKDPTKFIDCEGHRLQIIDMIDSVRNDRTPRIDGREGRKAVEIICGIYASSKDKKEVKLPL